MFKKILIVVAVLLGLIYGSGHSPQSLSNLITTASDSNAHSLSGDNNDGWGDGRGY